MIAANFKVCLDACVLANYSVCDLLLKLAEEPRLYSPVFSRKILDETHRVHVGKLDWPEHVADYFRDEIARNFPTNMAEGFEPIEEALPINEKDRHVLAAAIKEDAQLILTYNLKDFPAADLASWGIRACHPQDYLMVLYEMRPEVVVAKLYEMAQKKGAGVEERMALLRKTVPKFVRFVAEAQGWELTDSG